MAKGTPMLPNGKRDNYKANAPEKPAQAHKAAKPAPKSKGPVPKPMAAPKGTASGMDGKVAKGKKYNGIKRGK
jgi:hypothetical protein